MSTPQIPPHLAHLTHAEIIAQAKQIQIARERIRREAEAQQAARTKRNEQAEELAQTEILAVYFDDPVGFARDILGVNPWARSRDILEAVRDHRRVAVRSGHKVAKSFTLAILALWWVKTRKRGRVIATATKGEQIRDIFWLEVQSLHRGAAARGRPLGGILYDSPHLGLKYGDRREIIGKTSKTQDGAPGLGGYSGPEMLFIIDEASGVADDVLQAFKGNMAGGGKLIAAGNPLVTSGFFYEAFTDKAEMWHPIQISSEESPNVTGIGERIPGLAEKEFVDDYRKECGPGYETDPVYQTRVRGEFPSQGPNAIIGLALVDRGAEAWETTDDDGLLDLGVDVAREGDDESAVCSRRGLKVYPIQAYREQDSFKLAAHVREIIFGKPGEHRGGLVRRGPGGIPVERPRVKVDIIGVGAGVYDVLSRYEDIEVFGVNVANSPTSKPGDGRPGYDKLRDQLWFAAKQFLLAGGTIPPDSKRLRSDLVAPKFDFNAKGDYKVEPKDVTKKRIKRSPDHGDAYCLCVYDPPPSYTPPSDLGASLRPRTDVVAEDDDWDSDR